MLDVETRAAALGLAAPAGRPRKRSLCRLSAGAATPLFIETLRTAVASASRPPATLKRNSAPMLIRIIRRDPRGDRIGAGL